MKTQKSSFTKISNSVNEIGILETDKLAGFCDDCEQWFAFIRHRDPETCPKCGANASKKHSFQITTQRTLNVDAKKINLRNVAA